MATQKKKTTTKKTTTKKTGTKTTTTKGGHEVTFALPARELANADLTIVVRTGGKTLGTLCISRGGSTGIPRMPRPDASLPGRSSRNCSTTRASERGRAMRRQPQSVRDLPWDQPRGWGHIDKGRDGGSPSPVGPRRMGMFKRDRDAQGVEGC